MENKEITAVEWLIEKIEERNDIIHYETDDLVRGSMISFGYSDLYEQAKQMEKQHIEETCISVIEEILNQLEAGKEINSKQIFEKYYNDKFKN